MKINTKEAALNWVQIPGTPNYVESTWGLTANYKHAYGGFASYTVAKSTEKKHTSKNTLCVGGLPKWLSTLRYYNWETRA